MAATKQTLQRLDPPPLDYSDFSPAMKRWLGDITDVLNATFQSIEDSEQNIRVVQNVDIGGSGAGPIIVPLVGLTTGSIVLVNLISSTNPVTVTSVVSGTDQFSVTFSGDPGASAIISYVAFIGPQ